VKRLLLPSKPFLRSAKRFILKNPSASEDIHITLALLAENAFDPRLRTHKLKGGLAGSWSCSAGYDLRIVFEFVQHEGNEAILLERVGTHDEVY
jgi:mRNA-degrading endonuclease YafQ of YafQ-DinJ toxin-antitoxin module